MGPNLRKCVFADDRVSKCVFADDRVSKCVFADDRVRCDPERLT